VDDATGSTQTANGSNGFPIAFVSEELAQAVETYRTYLALFASVGAGLVTANVAVIAFAATQGAVFPIMCCALFPLTIWLLAERLSMVMTPVVYTVIRMEYLCGGDKDDDWLMLNMIRAMDPTLASTVREAARRQTSKERLEAVEGQRFAFRLLTPVRWIMAAVAAVELLLPLLLLPSGRWEFI
jgi:hypothetical protein